MRTPRRNLRIRHRGIMPSPRRCRAASPALHLPDRSVESNDVAMPLSRCSLGGGRLMQPVDVLRDECEVGEALAPGREHSMRRVRLARGDLPAAPVVPLPHQARITRKCLRRGERLGFEALPKTVSAAERRHAARGRDTGAGQHRDANITRQPARQVTAWSR